jgi:hypothetical protein
MNDEPRMDHARLSVELEMALVRELQRAYADINATHFRRKLRPTTVVLSEAKSRLGRWIPDVRGIELGRGFVLSQPWGVVLEVLKHEMAHQYVSEVLGKVDETAHGPAFRDVCARLGIDGAAAGVPVAGNTGRDEARVLERIARLLALAESPNVHEAQAAMNAAQRLMLKYNLETVAGAVRSYGFRHLGTPSGRVCESERILGNILDHHFFVDVIWVPVYRPLEQKRGSVLEVCGSHANLEMATYVHAFLTHTADQLWLAHKRDRKIRINRDRRTFLAGVMAGFLEKLNGQRRANQAEGLIWVGDADLSAFYRKRHPRIAHVRHQGSARNEAHLHGREAGRRIVLHRPVTSGPGNGARLLTR